MKRSTVGDEIVLHRIYLYVFIRI